MTPVTLREIGDVPVAVAAMLGFQPVDSLVVVGLGGGPTARVDLSEDAVWSVAPAVRHWDRVLLVIFSDDDLDQDYAAEFTTLYPSVGVEDVLTVRDGMVTSLRAVQTVPVNEIAPGILGDRIVASSRDALVAEAEGVNDPAEALRLAEVYYGKGDGARAWIYVDRARALGADPSALERSLIDADNPRDRR